MWIIITCVLSCMKLSHPTHTIKKVMHAYFCQQLLEIWRILQRNISHVTLIIQRGNLERQKLSLDLSKCLGTNLGHGFIILKRVIQWSVSHVLKLFSGQDNILKDLPYIAWNTKRSLWKLLFWNITFIRSCKAPSSDSI